MKGAQWGELEQGLERRAARDDEDFIISSS